MQQDFGGFLRYGGNGQYVVTRRENRVIGYRSAISIKSVFPNYSSLLSDFVNRLDEVVSENSRMLLNALTSPDSVPIVSEADLFDVSEAKDEALRQWGARLPSIFSEYHTHPQRLRPRRVSMEERLLRAFAALVNQLLQDALGIEQYIWRTRDDAKVRDSHAEYDERVFRWDSPPEGGHPGQTHNCRCVAEPIPPGTQNNVVWLTLLRPPIASRATTVRSGAWRMACLPDHQLVWLHMQRWRRAISSNHLFRICQPAFAKRA